MKKMSKTRVLLVSLLALLIATVPVLGYESERMDYGNIDFGGRTVTFVSWEGEGTVAPFVEGGKYAGRLEEAKEKFNIGGFDFVKTEWTKNGETMRQRLISGESKYDIWTITTDMDLSIITSGAAFPVSEILPDSYYENLPAAKCNLAEALSVKGQKYLFSGVPSALPELIAWNKTVFEKEGLTTPQELYESGNWNWDTFEELAKKATRDTNGDGEIDQIGLENVYNWNCYPWVYANGGKITAKDENGKWIWAADQPAAVAAFERILKWIQVDKITGGNANLDKFMQDKAAMAKAGHVPLHILSGFFGEVDVDYGLVPMPMGPDAEDYQFPMYSTFPQLIPINSEAPLETVALLDFFYSNADYEESIKETKMKRSPDKDSYMVMEKMFAEMGTGGYWLNEFLGKIHTWDQNDLKKPLSKAIAAVEQGEKSAATALKEVAPQAEAIINDIFE